MKLKAIQQRYKGYHFRSTLEARWAICLDTLGWKWRYEPEGYDLGEGDFYLPDFFLPECEMFIEVKGIEPNQDEIRKAKKLCLQSQMPVVFAVGDPSVEDICNGLDGFMFEDGSIFPRSLAISTYCKRKWGRAGFDMHDWVRFMGPDELDVIAVNAARSARFGHGARGA